MTIHKLILKKENNPEFYELAKKHNLLKDKWSDSNDQLYGFKVPGFCLFKTKSKLRLIGVDIAKLKKDFLVWYEQARTFCYSPIYKMEGTLEEQLLTFLHFNTTLLDSMNKLDSDMFMLAQSYNNKWSEYRNQLNFMIAMAGLAIAAIGLVIAL